MRMDLRGCGAGFDKARGSCHAGKYDDIVDVLNEIKRLWPCAPVTLVGFSMAGSGEGVDSAFGGDIGAEHCLALEHARRDDVHD